MADTRKDIFLLNELQPGVTQQQLVHNLASLFKKDEATIEKMLAQSRFLIKKDVDAALAAKYQSAITKAGGGCALHDHVPELPLVPPEPILVPDTVEPKSPQYGRAFSIGKSKRTVKVASFVIFLVLLGILAAIFVPLLREAPQRDALQNHSSLSPASQSPAPKFVSTPIESPVVALSQEIFSADRRLSIDVPDDWQERKNISEGASIGAGSSALEVYVIVMAESRADFNEDFTLSNYTDAVLSLLKNIMTSAQISASLRSYKINGLPAEQTELTGEVDGQSINYLLTTIESDKGFFHVLSWTTLSRYQANRSLMQDVTNSLVIRSFPAY